MSKRRHLAIGRISRSTKNGLMRSGFLSDAWLSLSCITAAEETGARLWWMWIQPRPESEVVTSMRPVIEILTRNPTAPPGLFDHGTEVAQELGYRMFRIRLFADRIGWQTPAEDADRA
jgi:hypothetical protein